MTDLLAVLSDRAVLAITGDDRVGFLQGLTSNDVTQAGPARAVWSALLTPQGRWLADFFIFAAADRLLLDCERAQREAIGQRLSRFRLRAKVAIAACDWHVAASWPGAPASDRQPGGSVAAPDPRLPEAGFRLLAPHPVAATASEAEYHAHRIALGLPDGSRDLDAERTLLLEAGFDELHGVSWSKGCYMGQELTARTRYRGLVKRRLIPVAGEQALAPGPILADGQAAGTLRSVAGRQGLAMLRLDALHRPLTAAGQPLRATPPAWIRLPHPTGTPDA